MNSGLESALLKVRWILIRLNRIAVLRALLRLWCRAGARMAGLALTADPCVTAVYSRHTHPRHASFVPGHSDLDLTILLVREQADDPACIEAVVRKAESLRALHYYINPNDIRLSCAEELEYMTGRYSSPFELLYTPRDWSLVAGRGLFSVPGGAGPARDLLPLHPEFNRFWGHLLQEYLLDHRAGPEDQYLRVYYRSAVKQQLLFLAARGRFPPNPPGPVSDDMADEAFAAHPGIQRLLRDIRNRHFWRCDALSAKCRILYTVFQSALDFFQKSPLPARSASVPRNTRPSDGHWKAYEEANALIRGIPGVHRRLRCALCYPVPHCPSPAYHLDLLFSNGLAYEAFQQLVLAVLEAFPQRELQLTNGLFVVSLMPEALMTPRVLPGFPYPFLAEHMGRFAGVLGGPRVRPWDPPPAEADLRQWCRIFFPYHAATLNRRVDRSSRTVNFCQLASIRIYLASGRICTDPAEVRRRHRELFEEESPADFLWEYLLRDGPGRTKQSVYHAALVQTAREYRAVDALL